jgi:predicted SnoaL-like aldol condensation-catalyzing enzyme
VSELNKSIAAAIIHALGSPNYPAMTAGYARDAAYHGDGVELQGREAIVAYARTFKDARPDLKFQMNGQRADGDIVVSRAIAMARGFLVDITSTMRFERGRVVEEWATYDEMTNEAANLAV